MIIAWRNILCLLIVPALLATGCSARSKVVEAGRPNWEPVAGRLTPAPQIAQPEFDGRQPWTPEAPFNASDFAMGLSKLSSQAASDIAALRAEAEIDASFPDEASAMLEETAGTLRAKAKAGYDELELDVIDDYKAFVEKMGPTEDNINLGAGMEFVLGRDLVGYYQLNSTKINEMKKAYWTSKLAQLRGELAAERSRFHFNKVAMLLSESAKIGAGQREELDRLETRLKGLAMDYASRVQSAIADASRVLVKIEIPSGAGGGELDAKMDEFEKGMQEKYKKAQAIAGS